MLVKTITAFLILFVCILFLPVAIGIIGGVMGAIAGLVGALFGTLAGIIGGIFGAIFGVIEWLFERIFGVGVWNGIFCNAHVFVLVGLVILFALLMQKKR